MRDAQSIEPRETALTPAVSSDGSSASSPPGPSTHTSSSGSQPLFGRGERDVGVPQQAGIAEEKTPGTLAKAASRGQQTKMRRSRQQKNSICPAPRGLSEECWNSLVNDQGQVVNMMVLLKVIQQGGIDRHIRPEVWPLLLGCFKPEDDTSTKCLKVAEAEAEYSRLSELCGYPAAACEYYRSKGGLEEWNYTMRRILTDSVRSGRDGPLFKGDLRERTTRRLEGLLLAYALADPAIGYCQGMADIAVIFLHLYSKDFMAFWLFKAMMQSIRENFAEGMLLIHQQMQELKQLLATIDPHLCRHLEELGVGNFEVSFQMFLLIFRRELPFEDTFMFWEVLWSCEALAQQPLRVYCAAVLFEWHRRRLLRFDSLEEVIKFVNALPSPLDALRLAGDAFSLWSVQHNEGTIKCCGGFHRRSGSSEHNMAQHASGISG